MADDVDREERVQNGWVRVGGTGSAPWVAWQPDEGHEDFPGRTYTHADLLLPDDFPDSRDPDVLLAWGVARWRDR